MTDLNRQAAALGEYGEANDNGTPADPEATSETSPAPQRKREEERPTP